MKIVLTRCSVVLLALSGFLLAPPPPAPGAEAGRSLSILPQAERGELQIRYADRPLLVYAFRSNLFKPYVKELYTLKGDNLLLDAPPDHLHHHGVMYAITVNGNNFWEEFTAPGHQISAAPPEHSVGIAPGGRPNAAIQHRLYWVPRTNATAADPRPAAVLVENRTLLLTVDEPKQEVGLEWRSDFEVGPAAPRVKLTGSRYQGLGLRFIRAWDRVATHSNSEDLPYPTKGKDDVLEAKWAAVANTWGGREAMLALFARPAETRGTTRFFSMVDGFCYLSATQSLDKGPLEYSAGDKFTLRYLITVYPAIKSRDFLRSRHEEWLKN
jgi:hypothetical protein